MAPRAKIPYRSSLGSLTAMDDPKPLSRLHARALDYPEAYEELPWGHPAIKVRKKTFVFCSALDSENPGISVKLTQSRERALAHDSVSPMGYGLSKHGWCSFSDLGAMPLEELFDYLDESYRAVAPKTLLRKLGDGPPPARTAPSAPVDLDALPRVLVVGAGPRRAQRAVRALAERGVPAAAVGLEPAIEEAGELQPEIVVVDGAREALRAGEVLESLMALCPDARWFVAEPRPRLSVPESVIVLKEPPGAADSVEAVLRGLETKET